MIFTELKNGLTHYLRRPRLGVADVLYYKQLLASLGRIESAWETVLGSLFFLGPTENLLKTTNEVFAEVVPVLGEKADGEPEYVSKYRSDTIAYIDKFKRASETLDSKMKKFKEQD